MSHADEEYDIRFDTTIPRKGSTAPIRSSAPSSSSRSVQSGRAGAGDRRDAGLFRRSVQKAVYEQDSRSAPSEQLQDVRNRDAWNLSHYMYGDLSENSGRVRIPLDKAMEIESARTRRPGKTFYPGQAGSGEAGANRRPRQPPKYY